MYLSFCEWLVPELRLLERPTARVELFKLAAGTRFRQRRGLSLLIAAAYALIGLLVQLAASFVGLTLYPWGLIVLFLLLMGSIRPVACFLCRAGIRSEVRRRLNVAGIRVCMSCGYDLYGVPEPRCPECGASVAL